MGLRRRKHDVMGAGGNIASGYRRVRKGGRIKFDHFWHSHPRLAALVGHEVYIYAQDAFYNRSVIVYHDTFDFVCNAPNEYNDEWIKREMAKQTDTGETD